MPTEGNIPRMEKQEYNNPQPLTRGAPRVGKMQNKRGHRQPVADAPSLTCRREPIPLHEHLNGVAAALHQVELTAGNGDFLTSAGGDASIYRHTGRGIYGDRCPRIDIFYCQAAGRGIYPYRGSGFNLFASREIHLHYMGEIFPLIGCLVYRGRPFGHIERARLFVDISKRLLAYRRICGLDIDSFQTAAIVKSTVSYRRQLTAKRYRCKAAAFVKSTIVYLRHPVGYSNGIEAAAFVKSKFV